MDDRWEKTEQTDSRREQLRLINATIAIHKNKESLRQANRERFNTAKPVYGIDVTVTANNMKKAINNMISGTIGNDGVRQVSIDKHPVGWHKLNKAE